MTVAPRACGKTHSNDALRHPLKSVSYLITFEVTLLLVLFLLPLPPVEIMFCLNQDLDFAD
jgi:hypothetical protein